MEVLDKWLIALSNYSILKNKYLIQLDLAIRRWLTSKSSVEISYHIKFYFIKWRY